MSITIDYNNKQNNSPADHILVVQAQNGDKSAFDQLYRRHKRKVIALANRFTKNSGDAEDVAQTTFLKAYQSLDQFRGDSQFSTWLHRITVNTAKGHLKAESKMPSLYNSASMGEDDSSPLLEARTDHDPAEQIAAEEKFEVLIAAINSLKSNPQKVYILREFDQLSYEEIAENLGIPIGSVRSRIHRAREQVECKLKDPKFIDSVFHDQRAQKAKLPAAQNDINPEP